ncbi:MAG TPA: patatin-like phospholipase family protein, partial [Ilumatobacteraceae bacterium]
MEVARVGLVLGGGGVAGLAFHAGTLAALHHDTGWDPATADIVVGTSAGSIAGCILRAGISTEDLAAWGSNVSPSAEGQAAHRPMLDHFSAGRPRVQLRPSWRPRHAHLYRTLLGSRNFSAAAMSVLPHGFLDLAPAVRRVDVMLPTWPDRPLWL